MIGIAKQTDYAARIVLHLACLPAGTRVSVGEIARQRSLPQPFIRRLTGRLVEAGILESSRGFRGGVTLRRPAAEISMLDVVLAMEGSLALNACVDHTDACPMAAVCPVQRAWTGLTRDLHRGLSAITFEALAHGAAGHQEAHVQLHGARSLSSRPAAPPLLPESS